MPNRNIKESICTSENLDKLSPEEELFFYRLIVNCDDYGRTDARPLILRAKCFPLRVDRVKEKDVQKWMDSLIINKLIVVYTVEGKQYLQVLTWEKHQQIRAKYSKYPAPSNKDISMISSDINCGQEISDSLDNDIRITNTSIPFSEIVQYLNQKTGKNYKYTTEATQKHIRARWNEGFRVEHFKIVVDNKTLTWLGTDQEIYLRPETLFGNKFDSYLNERPLAQPIKPRQKTEEELNIDRILNKMG